MATTTPVPTIMAVTAQTRSLLSARNARLLRSRGPHEIGGLACLVRRRRHPEADPILAEATVVALLLDELGQPAEQEKRGEIEQRADEDRALETDHDERWPRDDLFATGDDR